MPTEAWQRGPVEGYDAFLMPVVHSLLQVREEVGALAERLTPDQLWARPGGAASVGFHLRHIAGSTSRLLTYARGEQLTGAQLEAASREGVDTPALAVVVAEVNAAIDRALDVVRTTPREALLDARKVGRAGLPSTTLGLLFHIAEHATRHAGQALTTAKILGAI